MVHPLAAAQKEKGKVVQLVATAQKEKGKV